MTKKLPNSFALLREELWDRVSLPLGQFSFWCYLLVGVVAFGGLGIWVECLKLAFHSSGASVGSLEVAVLEYAPSLIGPAAMQLILAEGRLKFLRMLSLVVLITSMVASAILMLNQGVWSDLAILGPGVPLCALAISLWWVTNGRETIFWDVAEPEDAVGGSVKHPLPGNTEGFKT